MGCAQGQREADVETRELQALLAWSAVPQVGERTLQRLLDHARESRGGLAKLWDTPAEDLQCLVRLHPRSAAALAEQRAPRWTRAGEEAAAVRARGVDALRPDEPDYPVRLAGLRRWPMLFAYGTLGLLEEPGVAIVSSKTVTGAGLALVDALADALAQRDVPLISSIHRETYQAAAVAAKRHAGPSVMVLDRGLAEAFPAGVDREPIAPARVWDTRFDPDLQLLLSPFAWMEPWNARSGQRRDALIFDLAEVIVALEVRPGGNMERCCRAAAAAGKQVLVLGNGPDGPDGADRWWAEAGSIHRLPWSGADRTSEAVVRLLPGRRSGEADPAARDGWTRELGWFLFRVCERLAGSRPDAGGIGAFPAHGELERLTTRHGHSSAAASPWSWLLADLRTAPSPSRLTQLLDRVRRHGWLAALVPAAWLESPEYVWERERWSAAAALRLVARLPLESGRRVPLHAAAVLLERDGAPGPGAPVFHPETERMGRFHLRVYLKEILRALERAGRA